MKCGRPLTFAGAMVLLLTTAACSDDQRCPSLVGGGRYCLQPSTAIAPFEAQQKVETRFGGRHETMIVELEADASGIRFVGMTPFGQTLLRVNYDNQAASAGKLPDTRISPAQLVALLQLALWPADAVRTGLNAPLVLDEIVAGRRILSGDDALLTVSYSGTRLPYEQLRLTIPSVDLEIDVENLGISPIAGIEP